MTGMAEGLWTYSMIAGAHTCKHGEHFWKDNKGQGGNRT